MTRAASIPAPTDQASELRRLVAEIEAGPKALATGAEERPMSPAPLEPARMRRAATGLADWGRPQAGAKRQEVLAPTNSQRDARSTARVVAVASGKGGVGKTNVSVNLAAALAQRGCRVLLLDGDIGLANADVLCGLNATAHIGHVLEGRKRLDEIIIEAPGGFRLAPGGAGVVHALSAPPAQRRQFVRRLVGLERDSDIVLIDCAAGLGATVQTFIGAADLALVVATPEPTAIADAYALVKATYGSTHSPGTPRRTAPLGLVVNQARDEAEARAVFMRIAGVARRFLGSAPGLAGWVPLDRHVPDSVRAREPYLIRHPRCRAARATQELARELCEGFKLERADAAGRGSLLARLFSG